MNEPCPACKSHPCQGVHVDRSLELYASHRGLTVEQVHQQARFEERRTYHQVEKSIRASLAQMDRDMSRKPPGHL